MPESLVADVDQAFRREVHDTLVELGEGDTAVRDVEVVQVDNLLDVPTWQVTLFLPRPGGQTWRIEDTRALRRQAREATDKIAERHGQTLEGLTSVVLATKDAPESATAPNDEPEEAEVATSDEPGS